VPVDVNCTPLALAVIGPLSVNVPPALTVCSAPEPLKVIGADTVTLPAVVDSLMAELVVVPVPIRVMPTLELELDMTYPPVAPDWNVIRVNVTEEERFGAPNPLPAVVAELKLATSKVDLPGNSVVSDAAPQSSPLFQLLAVLLQVYVAACVALAPATTMPDASRSCRRALRLNFARLLSDCFFEDITPRVFPIRMFCLSSSASK